jgi:hypothetical protein
MEAEPLFPLPLERLLLLVSEMKVVLLLAKFVLWLSKAEKNTFSNKNLPAVLINKVKRKNLIFAFLS